MTVIQYCTLSLVRLTIPTISLTSPTPGRSYFIHNSLLNCFWFLSLGLAFTIRYFFAIVNMESNWSTAKVENIPSPRRSRVLNPPPFGHPLKGGRSAMTARGVSKAHRVRERLRFTGLGAQAWPTWLGSARFVRWVR